MAVARMTPVAVSGVPVSITSPQRIVEWLKENAPAVQEALPEALQDVKTTPARVMEPGKAAKVYQRGQRGGHPQTVLG
jgi:hypothetical protein